MYDELTEIDIKKMEEEIEYRKVKLAPELGAELKRTREFGDLSENAEYKEAKRAKRKNEGRIRYLENMMRCGRTIRLWKSAPVRGLWLLRCRRQRRGRLVWISIRMPLHTRMR